MSDQPETTEATPSTRYLPQLGDMLLITQGGLTVYVAPDGQPQPVNLVVIGTPPEGAVATFVVTASSPSGNQTKVSLQALNMGSYWSPGQNAAGQTYPIVLGPTPQTFIITASVDGYTIQTAFSPPGPFIHAYDPGTQVLTYGHDSPLIQGLFDIAVVG